MPRRELTIVCAWCATVVRDGGQQISHGICAACAASFLVRLPVEYLRSAATMDGMIQLFREAQPKAWSTVPD